MSIEEGARGKLKSVMMPTGKVYRGQSDTGDGDRCPVEGHGKMYVYGAKQWCPNQSHDNERIRPVNG